MLGSKAVGTCLILSAICAAASPALASYEYGMAAYHRGEYQKSLSLFKPLAEKGDARAQYMLGRHFQFGQAVKADRAQAYFWYGRAERGGFAEAKLFRHLLVSSGGLAPVERAAIDRRLASIKGGTKPATDVAAKPAPPGSLAQALQPPKPAGSLPLATEPPKQPGSLALTLDQPKPPGNGGRAAIVAMPDEKPSFAPPPARPEPPARKESTVPAVAVPPPRPSVQHVTVPRPPVRTEAVRTEDEDDDAPPTQPTVAVPPSYTPPARTYAAVPQAPTDSASDYYSGSDYWRGQQPRYSYPVRPQVYARPVYPNYPVYTQPAYRPQAYYGTPYPRYGAPAYNYGYRQQPYYAAPRPYYAPPAYVAPRAGFYANFGRFGVGVWSGRR